MFWDCQYYRFSEAACLEYTAVVFVCCDDQAHYVL
jgi:hypothetical protein